MNGGTPITLNSLNWNGDVLAEIPMGLKLDLFVPVVPSGKNKTLYIVEHNNNWESGNMHVSIMVNNIEVERLRTSYSNNPFASHYNSKLYSRYLALTIPAEIIPNGAKFVKVTIDMTNCNKNMYLREIGIHDSF